MDNVRVNMLCQNDKQGKKDKQGRKAISVYGKVYHDFMGFGSDDS